MSISLRLFGPDKEEVVPVQKDSVVKKGAWLLQATPQNKPKLTFYSENVLTDPNVKSTKVSKNKIPEKTEPMYNGNSYVKKGRIQGENKVFISETLFTESDFSHILEAPKTSMEQAEIIYTPLKKTNPDDILPRGIITHSESLFTLEERNAQQ